jgi:transposase-like protein
MRKKRLINTRLANVPVIVKGIAANQVDRVKEAILSGGFIGLKTGGDAQFLQLTETAALNEHMADCFQKMKDISGYSTVTFGEIAGANTSGDAVSMYFQPTTQTAQNQWIGWKAFYESINEKILRLYEKFGTSKEMFKLYGVVPRTTFEVVEGKIKAKPSSFMIEFNGAQIGGYYRSQIIVPQVTPKDEVAYKRLVGDMAVAGFLPKVTAYDEWGYTDPQEQIDLLAQEQSNPALNPEGMSKLINTLPQDPMGGMPVDAGMGLGGENVGLAQENGLAGIQ